MPARAGIDRLQRALGNRGMARLLRSGAIQAKLAVGPADDEYEREADRVADDVMRMPDPTSTVTAQRSTLRVQRVCPECEEEPQRAPLAIQRVCPECDEEAQRSPLPIQRACQECEELQPKSSATTLSGPEQISRKCPKCDEKARRQTQEGDAVQRKPDPTDEKDEEEEGIVQAKSKAGDPPEPSCELESYVASSRGGGQPLPRSTREHFEARFGHDFSGVRVHTESRSADAAAEINSYAFATGSDIHFGSGRFQPGTPQGDRLLGHELTHVLQQGNAVGRTTMSFARKSASISNRIIDPDDSLEQNADPVAEQIVSSTPVGAVQKDFGQDLSRVRVHTDSKAAKSARAIQSKTGSDPIGPHGHELTHVRQQSTSGSHVQRQPEPGAGTLTEPPTERPEPLPAGGEPEAAREAGLPPDVARRIIYAATVLRRITPLPEEDRVSLDEIIPGTEIYKRIKQRDALREQLNTTLETITSLETDHPYDPDIPMEYQHVMEGLDATAAQLTQKVERLDNQIELELARFGTDEAGLVELVNERFPKIWERRAKEITYTMLDENEEVAKYECERYSQQVCSPDTVGLLEADRRLVELSASIAADEEALNRAAAYRSMIVAGPEPRTPEELGIPESESSLIVYIYNFDEYQESLERRKAKYEAERANLIPEFPILGAKGYVPGAFSDVPEEDLAKLVGEPIDEILENIEDTRDNIEDDTIRVWDLHDVPALAFHELGVAEDSVLGDAVRSYIEDKKSDESWIDIALAAVGLVAGLIAVFATGGLALAAGIIAVGAGGASLYRSASRYGAESAAENVSLDPVIADISVNEPELLWVVLDVVGLGLDVGDVIKLLRPAARAVMATGDIATFASDVERLAPEVADRLVKSARGQLLERTGREVASDADLVAGAAGKVGRDLSPDELDAELRVVARSEPEQLAPGGEYLMEVAVPSSTHKWRLRRDGVWCRFSNGDLCLIPAYVPPRMRALVVEGGRVSAAQARKVLAALQADFPILREFPLNLAAIQRVLAKGPLVDHMKGQLLEELLAVWIRKSLRSRAGRAALGLGEGEGKLVFIEGWRITDAAGQPFTDGIIAIERGGRLEVKLVLEAKSGARTAEGLARDVETVRKMARAQRLELFREIREEYRNALEDYIRTNYPEAIAAYKARTSLAPPNLTSRADKFEELPFSALPEDLIIDVATHPRFRRGEAGRILTSGQGGQVTRDIERSFQGGIRVDGAEKTVAVTAGPQSTRFIAAVPEDVDTQFIQESLAQLGYGIDAARFPISAEDIVSLTTELAARISAAAQ